MYLEADIEKVEIKIRDYHVPGTAFTKKFRVVQFNMFENVESEKEDMIIDMMLSDAQELYKLLGYVLTDEKHREERLKEEAHKEIINGISGKEEE